MATKRFGDANWGKVCEELLASKWENFSLSNTDLDEYVGKDESFFDISGVKLENSTESQENDGISPSELTEAERDKIRKQNKEKILQIQRLYHLTENAKAIAYLIESGFKSAYQISTMSESEFMARHGSGIGKAAEARRIHRLARITWRRLRSISRHMSQVLVKSLLMKTFLSKLKTMNL